MSFGSGIRWALGATLAIVALSAAPARGETDLLGPLRIRDMTPFNLLRLDMLPAHAVAAGPGSWAIEADVAYSNTFVMSDNVRNYLEGLGGGRRRLTQADADAILRLGEDAYYVDGEFGLLELTFHYRVSRRSSVYMTLTGYNFTGGIFDGTIESFHDTFGLDNGGRDLVARNGFQVVSSLEGVVLALLRPPVDSGLGDPVFGVRHSRALGGSRFSLVFDGEAKLALRGERLLLSTGTNDYGLQTSLQGKFRRQAVYLSTSLVWTDGRVLGVKLERQVVPTVTAAYEVGVTRHTNAIVQVYASQSTVQDSTLDEIKANKYQASLGLRSRRGHLIYGFAVTENLKNFDNTPDVGVSLTVAWVELRP
jgi:hypothetical protein